MVRRQDTARSDEKAAARAIPNAGCPLPVPPVQSRVKPSPGEGKTAVMSWRMDR